MPSYNIRQLQLSILDILVKVDKTCREHGLTYYLAAGSMLGAVRHKGCIPWDDDIDIAMPRKDYDILIEHSHEWLPQPLEFLCYENTKTFPGTFGKIVDSSTTLIERKHHSYVGGIYIDVFPLDSMVDSKLKQRKHMFFYSLYTKIIYLLCRDPYKHGKGIHSWLPLICQRFISLSTIMNKILCLQKEYSNVQTELVIDHDFGMKGIMCQEIYGSPKEVEFEGFRFYGVERPNDYLSALYGDYMTIPSGNKQKQHNFYYLDYHLPYRQYQDNREFVKRNKKS